ncbi:MAG: ABC transporter ATP-binding protein [Propionibacteriaceae bacterium]|jgi:putative ABC transport system ATP-binding protein|nr:ABC transporter ATP-binding protein [Propionibacteriaceae bacterium]
MSAFVSVRDVGKSFVTPDGLGVAAVVDACFEVERGEAVALMGVSGSGKSTLLALLGGIERADSGEIEVAGEVITRMREGELADYRAGLGFVFQQFHLIPALSALDNVLVPLIGRVRSVKERRIRALEALESVGLAARAASMPYQLSGGEQQWVAIARALVVRPKLVLADEPTGNLDSGNAHMVMELLLTLQHESDAALLVATHDPAIGAACDSMLLIADGKITPADLSAT